MATETKLHRVWNWVKGLYAVRDTESDDLWTPSDESPAILKLRANFENREAIYLEKGALRVRVSNIRRSVARRIVWAKVEEVQTPGLGVGMFDRRTRNETTPRSGFPFCGLPAEHRSRRQTPPALSKGASSN